MKKYWLILLFLKIFFAHLSQCFPLHVSTQSEFSVSLITCILVLHDHSNLRLVPCILHVVSIRSARALGALFQTKHWKSGSPSCDVPMIKTQEFIVCFYSLPSTFVSRTGLKGAHDTQMFFSNFLFFFSFDTWLNISKAFFAFGNLMHSKGVCLWLCDTVEMSFSFIIYQYAATYPYD